jgi:2-amino-4-hydroxy-6-hydroxymethyldihydropteridine diphosphokinase
VVAVLSLGSNLGDRRAHLRAALEVIGAQLDVIAVSPSYETAPIGGVDQPDFLNCVAFVDTADAEEALAAAHRAEEARGRLRGVRWGPRTLDVDVVDVDGQVRDDPRLTLPHPRAFERAFVLRPWLDLDPEAVVAGHGSVRTLLARLPVDVVRRVDR